MNNRILFFTGAGYGGAERMTILYAKILQKAGFNCKIFINVKPGNKEYLSDFIPDNLEYEIIETRHRYLMFYYLGILTKEKVDVVFSSMPTLIQLLIVARWIVFGKFAIVARCFNMPSQLTQKTIKRLRWLKYVDIIIGQTDEMSQELVSFVGLPSSKVFTMFNPIDKDLIDEKIKEPFMLDANYVNFSAVGRIAKRKDLKTMIAAFKEVLNTIPNSRLYIVGTGSDEDYYNMIKRYVEKLDMKSQVFFEGFQTNPYKYIYHSDAFLLSSEIEGLPNVLLDALYLNKPVVVTRSIPFIKQIIKEGINGYSVDIHDYHAFSIGMSKAIKMKNIKNDLCFTVNSEEKMIKLFSELRKS